MKKIVALLSLGILASFFWYNNAQAQVKVGHKAPGFNLKNIDGNMVDLSDFSDQEGVIVIFTCNHCPYSKMYEDRIVELDKKFRDQGFPVVAINPNDPSQYDEDSYENMKKRAEEKGFTFPYLIDDTQEIAKSYGATRTPHVYLLVTDNKKFTVEYIGAIDDNPQTAEEVEENFVENAIAALKDGKKPDPAETKAIGCGIKWKK